MQKENSRKLLLQVTILVISVLGLVAAQAVGTCEPGNPRPPQNLPDAINCTFYWRCINGVAVEMPPCPRDWGFVPSANACVLGGCNQTTVPDETTTATTATTGAGETTVAGDETTVAGEETTVAGEETTVAGEETTPGNYF